MDTLRHLIGFFIKVAFAFFFFAMIWWLLSILFPMLSFHNIMPTFKGAVSTSSDILPSPRLFGTLFKKPATPDGKTNLFVAAAPYKPGSPYNGYNTLGDSSYTYSYIEYGRSNGFNGATVLPPNDPPSFIPPESVPTTSPNTLIDHKALYIRNLSIFKGGHVYNGLSFIGEAKSSMFRDGKFPIVVVDTRGNIVGVSFAIAESRWAVPGWVRFHTTIDYLLPSNVPCTMIFEEALSVNERVREPARVPFPISCN
jgi:hypothetical protein